LKTGILVKRGEINKNWKQRFFVAYNAKDNYKIDYLDGPDEKGKLKGTINPAGYYATEFNSDDIAEYGENGIKLVPWSYRRRTWYIKCNDNQLRSEWMDVFRTACWKAVPPHDQDEVIAEAFDIALRNTRWQCCFRGLYYGAGSEAERLGEFILDVLDQDILNEIIGNIVDGPARSMTIDLIRKTAGTTVNLACSAAWVSSAAAVRSVSDKIQSTAKELIRPVIEKQLHFKDMIVEKITGVTDPFLADKGASLLAPVFRVVFRPIIRAFTEAARGFHRHVATLVSNGDFAGDKFNSRLDYCDWEMDWWSGPVGEAYQITWRMYTIDLNEVLSILAGGCSSLIYNKVNDRLRDILHRAVYTFGKKVRDGGNELHHALTQASGLLFHDAYIMIRETIKEVLNAVIDPMVQELVLKPSKELIEPLQEMVESIPIPGLSVLIDLNALLEDAVGEIVGKGLDAILSGSLGDIQGGLEEARLELGVAQITL
jgi:hypothetical protein